MPTQPNCVVCGQPRRAAASHSPTIDQLTEEELGRLAQPKSNGEYAHRACAADLRRAIGIAKPHEQIDYTEFGCMPIEDKAAEEEEEQS